MESRVADGPTATLQVRYSGTTCHKTPGLGLHARFRMMELQVIQDNSPPERFLESSEEESLLISQIKPLGTLGGATEKEVVARIMKWGREGTHAR